MNETLPPIPFALPLVPQPISELITLAFGDPEIISLAAGLVDYDSLPVESMRHLCASMLQCNASGRIALQYGTTAGVPRLRSQLALHMERLEDAAGHTITAHPDHIVVTSGSQQLLHILAEQLLTPGDIVLTEWPSYFVYTQSFSTFEAVPRSIEMDEHGIIPEKLDDLLRGLHACSQLQRVKMLYLVTYHQNPTGITLSASRKQRILEIIQHWSRIAGHRILIIEDAAYRELAHTNEPESTPPSFRAFDPNGDWVAICQTFSKPFAPGLKTGYGLLPADLVPAVTASKGGRDFGSSNVCHQLLAQAMEDGAYANQVTVVRAAYAVKAKATLDALETHLSDVKELSWSTPSGGMYVWLTLPSHIDTGPDSALFKIALQQKVLYVPGKYCFPNDPTRTPPKNTIRLAYGVPCPEKITEGIRRLATAIRHVLNDE